MIKNLKHFEEALGKERAVLIGELKKIGVIKDKNNPDEWQAVPGDIESESSDSGDVADRIESFEENTALVNELEGRLNAIDMALKNIKNGKYGLCKVCGKEIEEDRLNANPAAETCKDHINVR